MAHSRKVWRLSRHYIQPTALGLSRSSINIISIISISRSSFSSTSSGSDSDVAIIPAQA